MQASRRQRVEPAPVACVPSGLQRKTFFQRLTAKESRRSVGASVRVRKCKERWSVKERDCMVCVRNDKKRGEKGKSRLDLGEAADVEIFCFVFSTLFMCQAEFWERQRSVESIQRSQSDSLTFVCVSFSWLWVCSDDMGFSFTEEFVQIEILWRKAPHSNAQIVNKGLPRF